MKKLIIVADDPHSVLGVFVDLNAPIGGNGSVFTPYNLEDLNKILEKSDLSIKT